MCRAYTCTSRSDEQFVRYPQERKSELDQSASLLAVVSDIIDRANLFSASCLTFLLLFISRGTYYDRVLTEDEEQEREEEVQVGISGKRIQDISSNSYYYYQ